MTTESEPETHVTPEMIAGRDKWSEPASSPPITANEIRKWAIAVWWPKDPPPLHWDEAYARKTRYGGIIAPYEFNPFADMWPAHHESGAGPSVPRTSATSGMNGGQIDEYFVPMRPGDIITSTSALVDWNERTTRLGLTCFTVMETRWTNQLGELVRTRRRNLINYTPAKT